ncbi:hypothetical protein [Pelomonas cellulosilytica]|uniref:MarR family transcriptional regulator n=1 Tax=Pelomonas cellulosilytica TaxID=2906762 RepID=A0ABS8XWY3_9BURK|nr:hypothetical protein [Pelomonas sp. P8]MCE4557171.1 hypothetical protein [Pelomonas sp. P8]
MELKPQDLLVLLKAAAPQRWTYAALGEALAISVSEAHASVKRAVASGLAVAHRRGQWSPISSNLVEFMLHGVHYIWPVPRACQARSTYGLWRRAPGQPVDGGSGEPRS